MLVGITKLMAKTHLGSTCGFGTNSAILWFSMQI